jgi:outer membrane immunogenic protein
MISKFTKLGLATLGLLATSFAANAADMPIKGGPYYKAPPRSVVSYYNWTGFYAGVNGGYSWGTSNWDLPVVSNKPKGWMAGGTVGYNWQSGAIVYGLEGDFDWADVSSSSTCAGAFTCTTKERWFATARGRIGYAFDRWLPYLTGGAAFGNVKASITSPALGGLSGSDTMVGWTVGGGLEYAFLGNWTAKVEYLYADLGKFNCSGCVAGLVTDNVSFTQNIVRAGLNYKFSGPIFSRY